MKWQRFCLDSPWGQHLHHDQLLPRYLELPKTAQDSGFINTSSTTQGHLYKIGKQPIQRGVFSYLATRLTRRSSQSRGSRGSHGSTLTTGTISSLLPCLSLWVARSIQSWTDGLGLKCLTELVHLSDGTRNEVISYLSNFIKFVENQSKPTVSPGGPG